MKVDESGWHGWMWMKVDKIDENGWKCMKMDENGLKWITKDKGG